MTPASSSSLGDVQGRLAAELDDDAFGLFFFIDAQHIFDGQRFKIELVGGVVVGGNGFRVAVDHDGFVALLPDGEGGMDAAVVEFNALADPVGAAAQDHDFFGCCSPPPGRGHCRWNNNRLHFPRR